MRCSDASPSAGAIASSSAVARFAGGARKEAAAFAGAERPSRPGHGHAPLIRDPIDLLRLALLVGLPVTLALGPREQSFRLFLTFLLTLVPRALDAPRPFDLAFVLAISFQAWGNVFGAFEHIYGYDKVVHFTLPMAASALAYLALVRFRVIPDISRAEGLRARPGTVLLVAALGLAFMGGLYELYEWFADHALGAHLYVGYTDSIGDLTDDTLGAVAGGLLVLAWKEATRGARRRRPTGASHHDDPLVELGDSAVAKLRPDRDLPHRGPQRAFSRLLVGSGDRLSRAPLDLLRASLLVGLAISVADAHWETALRFAVSLAAAWAVRPLDLPRPFDLFFLLALSMQAWGARAAAFADVGGFDAATHVVVSAAFAPVVYLTFVRRGLLPALSRRSALHQSTALALTVTAFGFSVGILYEIYVYPADHLLGASIAAGYSVLIGRLALDLLGAIAGATLVVFWALLGLPFRLVGSS